MNVSFSQILDTKRLTRRSLQNKHLKIEERNMTIHRNIHTTVSMKIWPEQRTASQNWQNGAKAQRWRRYTSGYFRQAETNYAHFLAKIKCVPNHCNSFVTGRILGKPHMAMSDVWLRHIVVGHWILAPSLAYSFQITPFHFLVYATKIWFK